MDHQFPFVLLTLSAQPLGKVSQRLPLSGVHVDVLSVADVFIVDNVVLVRSLYIDPVLWSKLMWFQNWACFVEGT